MPAQPFTTRDPTRPWAAIAAVTTLTLPLGSIYAFSVFLQPIEAELGIPRSAMSLVFGLAAIGFTAGMNLAPMIYRLASPAILIMANAIVGALGIAMSAWAGGLPMLLLGYGVLFGVSGGTIFIILQQAVNILVRARIGLLNGYILGLWPMGAMIAAPLFGWSNARYDYHTTLLGLAGTILVCGAIAAWLTVHAGSTLPAAQSGKSIDPAEQQTATLIRICAVFFLAAAAGLTVLSQAVGIIDAYGGAASTALWAATGITAVIGCGRIAGGFLVDRLLVPFVSAGAHGLALTGTVILTVWPSPAVAVLALGMIGLGYGLVSGSTAGALAVYWPKPMYGKVAGKVYIAWCVAAVTLPVLAGHLFDLTGGYRATVLIAGCGNLAGCAIALGLPRRRMGEA
ncbi:MAG: MFS transporter [Acetobacteraceae bacterium]|nr:MFS transporter [Acetobacteraceae bacterium]